MFTETIIEVPDSHQPTPGEAAEARPIEGDLPRQTNDGQDPGGRSGARSASPSSLGAYPVRRQNPDEQDDNAEDREPDENSAPNLNPALNVNPAPRQDPAPHKDPAPDQSPEPGANSMPDENPAPEASNLGLGGLPLARVEAEICTLAGQIAAATSRFLRLLAEFDARGGWVGRDIRSCAHWLSWRCGLDLRTAREHVRVARALTELPKIRESFDTGRISYSKVRAIARVATPTSEADLLDAALHAPAAHIERLTRGLRTAQRNSAEPDDLGLKPLPKPPADPKPASKPRVRWHWDDHGDLVFSGRLSADDGARLLAASTHAMVQQRHTAEDAEGCAAQVPPLDLGPALIAMAAVVCAEPAFKEPTGVEPNAFELRQAEPNLPEPSHPQPSQPQPNQPQPSQPQPNQPQPNQPQPNQPQPNQPQPSQAEPTTANRPIAAPLSQHDDDAQAETMHLADGPAVADGRAAPAATDSSAATEPRGQRLRSDETEGIPATPAPPISGTVSGLTARYSKISPKTIEPDWDGTPLRASAIADYLTVWNSLLRKNRASATQQAS